jgi:predicted secreted hydrolase
MNRRRTFNATATAALFTNPITNPITSPITNPIIAHAAQATSFYPPVLPLTASGSAGKLQFPRDHGAHPLYRTEWWYVTGWLDVKNKPEQSLGFQVTFFRSRTQHPAENPSRFAPTQLLIAHAAIAAPKNGLLIHEELATRALAPIATFSETDCKLAIKQHGHEWLLERAANPGSGSQNQYRIAIKTAQLKIDLSLSTDQAPWLQGQNGFSQKGPLAKQSSYYYSRPQLITEGKVSFAKQEQALEVRGTSWFDHEWSSEILAEGAIGWDWLGLNMLDGSALTIFRIRGSNTEKSGLDIHHYAAWRSPKGEVKNSTPRFEALRRWTSKRTGATYPVSWHIALGDTKLLIEPLMDDQELDGRRSTGTVYWEGAVTVKDISSSGKLIGRGYLELTGYHQPIKL